MKLPTVYHGVRRSHRRKIMTPREALVRGGHKFPDQILEDLDRAGFQIVPKEAHIVLRETRCF